MSCLSAHCGLGSLELSWNLLELDAQSSPTSPPIHLIVPGPSLPRGLEGEQGLG